MASEGETTQQRRQWLKRLMGAEDSLFGPVARQQVLQMAAAEVIGTGMLLFLGCMGSVVGMINPPHTHLLSALTFGLTVMIVIQTFGHISKAHLNPAVTCALVVIGDLNVPLAGIYAISQVIGATLGYGVLMAITPERVLKESSPNGSCCAFCTSMVHPEVTPLQALLTEFLITSILILVVCAVFDRRNAHNSDSVPIKFGLTIGAIAMAAGPYTGASMNPARTFGPALWTGMWDNHWVYWLGPLASGLLTSAFYRFVFGVPPVQHPTLQEAEQGVPLTSIRGGGGDVKSI
ncbi:aquaporin AQPAe.a-like isoform X2 [Periplaneta americana]|uniref:aquaporin AQPAe.a-like isoform X2 n=1 Tax=Periplaneta americana TaxID=6978 RepID=UPI0037E9A0EE